MSIYEGHSVQDHEQFLMEELLPNIVNYSGRSNAPPEVVVMAAFLSLATILQSKGLGRETLMQAIDAAALQAGESEWGCALMALKNHDERSIDLVASIRTRGYRSPVAANSATDLGGSNSKRRNSAPITIAGAFFMPATMRYGGLCGSTFVCAGLRLPRSANPTQLATSLCLAAERGGSSEVNGATPMHILNPSKIRVAAHKAMALAALRADSSASVRLRRYNHHMDKARSLETQGGVQ